MQRTIDVYFLPEHVDSGALCGKTVVVIDVLRATTTICHALAAGANCVIPCLEVEEAIGLHETSGDGVVLGGERGGVKIAGFDLGNSPAEYSKEMVAGKTVVFTTTNGTRAMQHASRASRILLAAFVNLSAVCEQLRRAENISILCAGTRGKTTREDDLLAGAIANGLTDSDASIAINEEAVVARSDWRRVVRDAAEPRSALHDVLRSSRGGKDLIAIGLERDIETAAAIDLLDTVPELDLAAWQIATRQLT
jgi:2-phosphosulfolactate phosphatase